MARENPAFTRIREEYVTKYLKAREEADLRRAEVHLAIPEVAEIDRALSKTGLSLMEASMHGDDVEARIAAVRKTNEELRSTRAELLVAHGYPADLLPEMKPRSTAVLPEPTPKSPLKIIS